MTDTYTAEVVWMDGVWEASVRGLEGAHTHAKTLTALRKYLREVVVLAADRPDSDLHDEDAFTVELEVEGPGSDEQPAVTGTLSGSLPALASVRPDQALRQAADARRRAAQAEGEADHATTVAVLMAQAAGISMRDAAMLLGISHQRVAQIAAAASSDLQTGAYALAK